MNKSLQEIRKELQALDEFLDNNRMTLASVPVPQPDGTVTATVKDSEDTHTILWKDDRWNFTS